MNVSNNYTLNISVLSGALDKGLMDERIFSFDWGRVRILLGKIKYIKNPKKELDPRYLFRFSNGSLLNKGINSSHYEN